MAGEDMAGVGQLLANNPIIMDSPQVEVPQPVLEERKAGWKQFIDRIQSDPNIRMALISTGLGLMRSKQVGQNGWDVAANAIAQGLGTFQQGRQFDATQKLEQQKVQNQTDATKSSIENDATRTANDTTRVGIEQQDSKTRAAVAETNAALNERETKLKEQTEPIRAQATATSAQADLIRANAYKGQIASASGGTGQNVQLVNMRKQALMRLNPGLSEEEVTIQAQNDILFTGKNGGNISSLAAQLFKTNLAAWQGSFENLGTTPSPEVMRQLKDAAMEQAKEFAKLNQRPTQNVMGTGQSGLIDRSNTMPDQSGTVPQDTSTDQYIGRKVEVSGGGFAEIVGFDPAAQTVTMRLADGRTATQPLEAVAPYIIAE